MFEQQDNQTNLKDYRNYLLSEKERPVFYATKQARAIFGKGTSTGVSIYGNLEDLEKITIKDLEKSYKKLINNTECYIYILGNMEKEEVMTYIDRYLNKLNNCPNSNDLFINSTILKLNNIFCLSFTGILLSYFSSLK